MGLMRMFSTDRVKGTPNYIDSQKKYEALRTLLYFGISFSLLAAGWAATGRRVNLLSVVAVFGCLPGCKSLVNTIMFFKFKSCSPSVVEQAQKAGKGVKTLYDCVFVTYSINFVVACLSVRGNFVCGYTEDPNFSYEKFYEHIDGGLRLDGLKDVKVKIFSDLDQYLKRLEEMSASDDTPQENDAICAVLKSLTL